MSSHAGETGKGGQTLVRQLGRHERFCLARANIGFPPVLCTIAFGHGSQSDVERLQALLGQRVSHLLDSVPLLSCHVADPRSFRPRFARREGVAAHHVLFPIEAVDEADGLQPSKLVTGVQAWAAQHLVVDAAPLWRVRLLHHRPSARLAVVLHSHHIITDGRALFAILQLLLLKPDAPLPSAGQLQGQMASERQDGLPPTSDETFNPDVSWGWTAWALTKALLLPALPMPRSARNWLGIPYYWPKGARLHAKPATADVESLVVHVRSDDDDLPPGGVLANLKAQARQNGIKSVNAVLHSACVMALYAFVRNQEEEEEAKPLTAFVQTATSERDVEKHGMCAGNFVSIFDWSRNLSRRTNIWQSTREYAEELVSPAALARRKYVWGLSPDVLPEKRHKITGEQPTPWEGFFHAKAQGEMPFGSSAALSNLGLLTNIDRRYDGALWTQWSQVISSAFVVDALGWRTDEGADGLSMTISIRSGVLCSVGQEAIFSSALRKAVMLIANGQIGKDDTLGNVLPLLT